MGRKWAEMGQNKNLTKKSIFWSYEFSGGSGVPEGLGVGEGGTSGSVPDWPLCFKICCYVYIYMSYLHLGS